MDRTRERLVGMKQDARQAFRKVAHLENIDASSAEVDSAYAEYWEAEDRYREAMRIACKVQEEKIAKEAAENRSSRGL